jgi:DNA polymerase-1
MKLVSFDVETQGVEPAFALQPFRARRGEAWLSCWACATGPSNVKSVLLAKDAHGLERRVRTIAGLTKWLRECAAKGVTICGWNVAFDAAWLVALGLRDLVYANKWLDGMLLWKHLTVAPPGPRAQPSYGLKAAVEEFLPEYAGYEDDIVFDADEAVGLAALEEYNRKDALYTLQIVKLLWAKLTAAQRRCALVEAACLPMIAETYVEGLRADEGAALALAEKLDEVAKIAMVKLKLNTAEEIGDDVLASPVKLRQLLYGSWGLPIVKLTPKDAASTDRDALSQLAPLDSRAALLNEYREARNNRTKFALGAANSLAYNGDGRVRPAARVFGTYTGRMTYSSKVLRGKDERPSGIALHQWKRAPEFRDIILAPEGYTLLEFDFAGQEFRWMAVMSKDRTMLEMCAPGEDAHAYMGAKIGKRDYPQLRELLNDPMADGYAEAKSLRQFGKVGNLSCQYRTSAPTLRRVARVQYQLTLDSKEARAIHATYRATYPRVKTYWEHQIREARIEGYVSTIAGRRINIGTGDTWGQRLVVLPDGSEDIVDDRTWQCESTAINAPIQGSGADQKYLALMVLRTILPLYEGRLYFELHDGVYVVVPDRHAPKAYAHIKRALSALPYRKAWGVDLPVEFPVDAKAGKTWGSLKERRDWT